jgi:hypothetical protein
MYASPIYQPSGMEGMKSPTSPAYSPNNPGAIAGQSPFAQSGLAGGPKTKSYSPGYHLKNMIKQSPNYSPNAMGITPNSPNYSPMAGGMSRISGHNSPAYSPNLKSGYQINSPSYSP